MTTIVSSLFLTARRHLLVVSGKVSQLEGGGPEVGAPGVPGLAPVVAQVVTRAPRPDQTPGLGLEVAGEPEVENQYEKVMLASRRRTC